MIAGRCVQENALFVEKTEKKPKNNGKNQNHGNIHGWTVVVVVVAVVVENVK
jgi:galactose mutarotase-like enzyme